MPKSKVLIAIILTTLLSLPAFAAAPTSSRTPASGQSLDWHDANRPCWEAAGARHGIDPWLLYAVAYVESRYHPEAISPPNHDGSRDIGLMQINSTWLPTLRSYGVPRAALRNACASTYIGAWVLADNFRRYGYSWQAIAAYNVGSLDTPRRRTIGYAYASKVYAAYQSLAGIRVLPRGWIAKAAHAPASLSSSISGHHSSHLTRHHSSAAQDALASTAVASTTVSPVSAHAIQASRDAGLGGGQAANSQPATAQHAVRYIVFGQQPHFGSQQSFQPSTPNGG